jgi:tetratricopeptide (TPR) repeat protein
MAETESKADALVEEGLLLYSQGKLDAAVEKWSDALKLVPDHQRAREYQKYVDDNRAALEESFQVTESYYSSDSSAGVSGSATTEPLDNAPGEPANLGDEFGAPDPSNRRFGMTPVRIVEGGAGERHDDFQPQEKTPVREEIPAPVRVLSPKGAARSPSNPTGPSLSWEKPEPESPMLGPLPEEFEIPLELDLGNEGATPTRPVSSDYLELSALGTSRATPIPKRMPTPTPFPRRQLTPIPHRSPTPMPMQQVTPVPRRQVTPVPKRPRTPTSPRRQPTPTKPWSSSPASERRDSGIVEFRREAAGQLTPPKTAASFAPAMTGPELESIPAKASSASPEVLIARAMQLQKEGSLDEAVRIYQRVADENPDNLDAKRLLQRNRLLLLESFHKRLEKVGQVPVVQVPQHEIVWQKLDHRAGFLLSRIDGLLSLDDLLDVSGMDELETCRILCDLLDQGVIGAKR